MKNVPTRPSLFIVASAVNWSALPSSKVSDTTVFAAACAGAANPTPASRPANALM